MSDYTESCEENIMADKKLDHDSLPEAAVLASDFVYGSLSVNDHTVDNYKLWDHRDARLFPRVRQEFKQSPFKFAAVQAGLSTGSAFLKSLKELQTKVQSVYDAEMERIRVLRKYYIRWMDALQTRSGVNKARRREKISNAPKKSYVRARETCSKRGCYGAVYRDDLCYEHYCRDNGISPQGVTAK
jgi:hypothetical protein